MPTGYIQCFVLTMETGAVYLASVIGDDATRGECLAIGAVRSVDDSRVWDMCDFPVLPEFESDPHGTLRKLKEESN